MNQLTQDWTSLNLSGALQLVNFIVEQAESKQLQLAVAILDRAGTPLVRIKMDQAPGPSQEIALRKATTALAFQCATAEWDQRLASASEGVKRGLALQEGLVLFGGGEPLQLSERLVGAVGISGATEAQDAELARQAKLYFQQLAGSIL